MPPTIGSFLETLVAQTEVIKLACLRSLRTALTMQVASPTEFERYREVR